MQQHQQQQQAIQTQPGPPPAGHARLTQAALASSEPASPPTPGPDAHAPIASAPMPDQPPERPRAPPPGQPPTHAAPPAPPHTRQPAAPPPARLFGLEYTPLPRLAADTPARLFAVVDTEAEFDWSKPFARELTSVSAMDAIGLGQAVFDSHGVKPIYVVDYPIATQPRGYAPLRAILDRGGCAIGAHLHPWTTPPFEEALLPRNSYPGNLDPALEARKLASLSDAIAANFGLRPVFYKAGRYGFGPGTARTLARQGFRVDLSVLPGADLTRHGGPDFSGFAPTAYAIAGTRLLAMPMTRAAIGLMPRLAAFAAAPAGTALKLPSLLARSGLAETITLTPEGVTAAEQIRLIRTLHARGTRHFVLHYHSPSLSPGHTPYAKDRTGAETLLARLREVCAWFFGPFGGAAGEPAALLAWQDTL